jgi:hypothetical protein
MWTDLRLRQDGALHEIRFGDSHGPSHCRRPPNTVTIDGRVGAAIPRHVGEQLRRRRVDAATMRIVPRRLPTTADLAARLVQQL